MWLTEQKKEFLEILTGLCEIYDKQLSKKALEFYISVLEKYDFEDVKRALIRYVYNASGKGSFFPKPADIVALIEGDPDNRAEQAWTEVMQALEQVGTWKSIKFRDPIINTVVNELGGWIYLGGKNYEELKFIRQRFVRLYEYYAKIGKLRKIEKLPGRVEILNNQLGFENYELVILGTPLPKNLEEKFTFIENKIEEEKINNDFDKKVLSFQPIKNVLKNFETHRLEEKNNGNF